MGECRRCYGIKGGGTVQNWLRRYGKNELLNKVVMIQTLEERDGLKRLRNEFILSAFVPRSADLTRI
jgi:hypothetical protein